MDEKTKRIAELNDQCRQCVIMPIGRIKTCETLMTRGIAALPPEDQTTIAAMVRDYDDFSEDNNPYGERDFGAFTHNGEKIFWKIDYYAPDMQHGSEDPSDPEQTVRVLTIMLASEY